MFSLFLAAPRPIPAVPAQVMVPVGPPLSLWERQFQAAVPRANATKAAAECRSKRPCRCKILGECENGMTTEPTGRFPLHPPSHYCKVYSLCGDMLPMHLRPGTAESKEIVKNSRTHKNSQKSAATDPQAAAKKAAKKAVANAEATKAANAKAADKQATDRAAVAEAASAKAAADKQAADKKAADAGVVAAEASAEAAARDTAVRKDAADKAAAATAGPHGVADAPDAGSPWAGTVAEPAPVVPAYSAPAPSGSITATLPVPAAAAPVLAEAEASPGPESDAHQVCWSTREGVTDEWCANNCVTGCNAGALAMCTCGIGATKPKSATRVVPIDPNHVEGDSLTDWSGAPAPINSVPSANDCHPIAVGYSDFWCATTCATGNCPEDLCKCGAAGKQESDELFGKVQGDWAEAEKRARTAADTPGGCTVADCPGGLPSNAGKDPNSQESKEYEKAMDDWKEGEKRVKAADPKEAYPYGLPPAQQQQQQQQQQQADPSLPPKKVKCVGLAPFDNADRDQWCTVTCNPSATNQARICPPTMCKCEGDTVGESAAPVAPQPPVNTEESLENRDKTVADRDAKIAERDQDAKSAVAERDAKIAERDAETARILDEKTEREANQNDDWSAKASAERDSVTKERDEEIASRAGDSTVPQFESAHGLPEAPPQAAAAAPAVVPTSGAVSTAPIAAAPATAAPVPATVPVPAAPVQDIAAVPAPVLPDVPPLRDAPAAVVPVPALPDVPPLRDAPSAAVPGVPVTAAADTSSCKARSNAATDEWCTLTCQTGSCPETLCQCGAASSRSK